MQGIGKAKAFLITHETQPQLHHVLKDRETCSKTVGWGDERNPNNIKASCWDSFLARNLLIL